MVLGQALSPYHNRHPIPGLLPMRTVKSKQSRFFPPPTFLASPDTTECYSSTPKVLDSAPTESEPSDSKFSNVPTRPTHAQKKAASAACRALASMKVNSTFALSDNVSHANNTLHKVPIQESPSFPVLGESCRPSTPCSVSHALHGTHQSPPPPFKLNVSQSCFVRSYREPSEGITTFKPSPSPLITAPVTCPHPFINMPKHQPPPAVPEDLFQHSSSNSMPLSRNPALEPTGPEVQQGLDDFLGMGHPSPCWCSKHAKLTAPSCKVTAPTLEETKASYGGDLYDYTGPSADYSDPETDSDVGAVSMSPPSQSSRPEIDDLYDMVYPAESSDDEWSIISPGSRNRKLRSQFLPATPDGHVVGPTQLFRSPLVPFLTPEYLLSYSDTETFLLSPSILSPALSPVEPAQFPQVDRRERISSTASTSIGGGWHTL
ncbi:uncharacterized protein K460DRAFT_189308 [Cucurbitaria berberidis CBS 394.84]|uniref:Uncharacterized protein n=1 Tax=Cucurbitaria berberidis CBS 394.84 TaxID=1168544 RepID=A0A9P4GBL5_9PLEO|nr:uncharacterized protein K460DRAFT_189308 [Cucurbitaria berberidis CBS 394.84]KAF1842612.1 hypothetical protein K460DRAFT_189308 [Cucurbitaria berberidis CBS 394.84]